MNGKQLKNSILQWAIQGKLVPQDPNDEPASVLLEQIRAEKARLVKEKKIKKDKNESIIFRGDDNSHYEKFSDGRVVCIDDEIPFEIPESWEWERWGNIAHSIQYGYNAPAQNAGNARMVRISDIQDNQVLWDSVPHCNIKEEEIDSYLLSENDILFARTGGTVGKSFLVSKVPYKAIYAGYLIRTRYSSLLCPQYLKYFMGSQLYWDQLKEGTIATAQPNCNGKTLSRMILPIPPISEQHRIVEKLNAANIPLDRYSKVQNVLNQLNLEIKNKLKKSILQEAIQGRLVPQIAEESDASELLQQIEEEKQKLVKEGKLKKKDLVSSTIFRGDDNRYYEKIGKNVVDITDEIPFEIPESWKWCRIKSLFKFINGDRGKNYPSKDKLSKSGEIPFVSAINLHNDTISKEGLLYLSTSQYEKLSQGKLQKDDLVLCIRGSLGKVAVYPLDNGAIASSLVILRKLSGVLPKYALLLLNSQFFFAQIRKNDNGTAQPNLSAENVSQFMFPLPPLAEQHRIVAKIEKLMALIKK